MATKITNFAGSARLWQTFGPVSTSDTAITTDVVDLLEGDGPAFAIMTVGSEAIGAVVGGSLQSSADASAWVDIPDAVFADASGIGARAITFARPHRYVRAVLDVSNLGDPVPLALTIGQSRKLI